MEKAEITHFTKMRKSRKKMLWKPRGYWAAEHPKIGKIR
jgi:hypothetical protein